MISITDNTDIGDSFFQPPVAISPEHRIEIAVEQLTDVREIFLGVGGRSRQTRKDLV